jgi:hypothetical protein
MDETKPGLTVVEGGKGAPPKIEFPKDTRTSIQKRIQPKLAELKANVKGIIEAEFGAEGALKLGSDEHERRFARAILVEVSRLMFDAGVRLHNISNGGTGCGDSLRTDLLESGVIQKAAPATSAPWQDKIGRAHV